MSESFEYREVQHFTAGAVGVPGDRTFYLQVGEGANYVSVKLEKQQVEALAQFLVTVLEDLPATTQPTDIVELREPAIAEWVVGQIAVGVDDNDGEIVILVEELVPEQDEDGVIDPLEEDGARLRAHISPEQAAQFIRTARQLMKSGRPPCRLCGQPLDPSGHICPRLN